MSKLFEDSDSEVEKDVTFDNINNLYAKNYNNWRQKEELNKLKTKYGEEVLNQSDSSTSSSEDEDEDATQITKELEKDFFKTLANLKTKDPKIYDENIKFFSETAEINPKKLKRKAPPLFIKDYERKLLLENDGIIDDLNENINEPKSLTIIEEQAQIKNNIKNALKFIDDDDADDKDDGYGILKIRKQTDNEITAAEEDYKQWLKGQQEDINDDIKNELTPLKDYWNDPKLDKNEKFLRDYILNKRFMEPQDKDYIPAYDEIIHDSDECLSEDEKELERQEEFEHKYNYRFEEPDEEFIKRYPRTIESSLRTQDDRRRMKRVEIKERKQKEKQMKMEEIGQMQALKKKEIEEKIQKLKEITGNTEIAFDDNDIEGDFDPDSHDKRMQHLFNEDFYHDQEDDQKPEFPDLDEELEIENWDNYESQGTNEDSSNQLHCEDDNFNMDCEYDPTVADTSQASKIKRKRKRKTKFAQALSEPKPTFQPDNKTFEEYLNEYYKLECEDIIGDIPCRFKYRKVTPNGFGLTVEEILTANDRELNRWCSLKKAVQYRPENVEKYDVIAFDRKGKNETLKKKLLPSLFVEGDTSTSANKINSKILKDDSVIKDDNDVLQHTKSNKKKIKKSKIKNAEASDGINSEQEKPEGNLTKKEISKNLESLNLTTPIDISQTNNESTNNNNSVPKKKKKKKKSKLSTTRGITSTQNNIDETSSNHTNNIFSIENQTTKRKQKSNKHISGKRNNKFIRKDSNELDISDARLKAFGFKPKKFKNKLKYGQKK